MPCTRRGSSTGAGDGRGTLDVSIGVTGMPCTRRASSTGAGGCFSASASACATARSNASLRSGRLPFGSNVETTPSITCSRSLPLTPVAATTRAAARSAGGQSFGGRGASPRRYSSLCQHARKCAKSAFLTVSWRCIVDLSGHPIASAAASSAWNAISEIHIPPRRRLRVLIMSTLETMGKTRRGGKRIGEGQDGYLVDPPIPCEGEKEPRKGFVTKVPELDRIKELPPELLKVKPDVLAKLKEIDPKQEFFYYPVDCTAGTLTEENKADGIPEEAKPFAELIRYAPGGTWINPKYRDRNWGEWLKGRNEQVLASTTPRTDAQKQHLIKAVTLLHQNNIVHGDLHQGNIVIAADGLPRLIDFTRSEYQPKTTHPFNVQIEIENETLKKQVDEMFLHTSKPRGGRRTRRRNRKTKQWSKSRIPSGAFNRPRLGTRR